MARPARTSSNSIRASPISRTRCREFFSRHRCNRRRAAAGVVSGSAVQSGSRSRIAAIVSETVSPAKACRPVSISYSTQPNAQMSVRLSSGVAARLFRTHVGGRAEDDAVARAAHREAR